MVAQREEATESRSAFFSSERGVFSPGLYGGNELSVVGETGLGYCLDHINQQDT